MAFSRFRKLPMVTDVMAKAYYLLQTLSVFQVDCYCALLAHWITGSVVGIFPVVPFVEKAISESPCPSVPIHKMLLWGILHCLSFYIVIVGR